MLKKSRNEITREVKLKKIWGMEPGLYLFILYSALLLLLFFFLFIYPGLKNNGSVVLFTSEPSEVSIWADDIYAGATPCELFIPKGKHTIKFKKAFFTEKTLDADIGGRIFFSRFFPKKTQISCKLELEDLNSYLIENFKDFCGWGLINSFFSSYRPEPVLQNTINALPGSCMEQWNTEMFLLDSLKNIFSEELLSDFVSAYSLFKTGGNVLTAGSYIKILDASFLLLEKNPSLFFHLLASVNEEKKEILTKKADTEKLFKICSLPENLPKGRRKNICCQGIELKNIPGGTYILGNREISKTPGNIEYSENSPLPYKKNIESFYISEQITNREFNLFLSENSLWNLKNLKELMEKNLVTESYLSGAGNSSEELSYQEKPVRNISYYAAEAYCRWLNEKLPANLKESFYFRLPDEYEWEAFAKYEDKTEQELWDWCENWYFPAGPFYTDMIPSVYPGIEKSVRGGSWANEKGTVNISTRASQPPEWCTPFLGFRVILTGKQNGK